MRLLILISLLVLPSAAMAQGFIGGQVTMVSDGDTFWVGPHKIRLCGIQAPERNEPGYDEAKEGLEMLTRGKSVICRIVGSGTPCDGRPMSGQTNRDRIVAQCFVDAGDLAALMVGEGMAFDWEKFSGGHYRQ